MPYPNYTPESVTARGEEIYQHGIHKMIIGKIRAGGMLSLVC